MGDTLMDRSRNSSKYEYTFTVLQKNPPMYPCLYMLVLSVFLETYDQFALGTHVAVQLTASCGLAAKR